MPVDTNIDTRSARFSAPQSVKSGRGLEPTKKLAAHVSLTDLTDADTAQTFPCFVLPAQCVVMGMSYKIGNLAAAPDMSAALLVVGTAANPDLYIDDLDVEAGSGTAGFARVNTTGTIGDATVSAFPLPIGTAETLVITLTYTGDNIADSTAFDFEFFADIYYPEDPDA